VTHAVKPCAPADARAVPNQPMHRMSAPPWQSKAGGFIGQLLGMGALCSALIDDLLRQTPSKDTTL